MEDSRTGLAWLKPVQKLRVLPACGCSLPCPGLLARRPSLSSWAGGGQTPGWCWASCSGQLLNRLRCGFPQYYEMSYGLNIEMHKQVSAVGPGRQRGRSEVLLGNDLPGARVALMARER